MLEGPQYRVLVCRLTLQRLRQTKEADAILRSTDPAALAAIESGNRLMWMPTAPLDHLGDVMFEAMGPEGFRDFYDAHLTTWLDCKLFRPLNQAADRIFGNDPGGHLKWMGRAWQLTSRNLGRVDTTETDDGIRITYSDVPDSHCGPRMAYSIDGSIRGVVRAMGKKAHVEHDEGQRTDGTLTFDISW